jgi:hypothetical protein
MWLQVMARLRPGMTIPAEAAMAVLCRQVLEDAHWKQALWATPTSQVQACGR